MSLPSLPLSRLLLLTFEPTVKLVAIFPWFSLYRGGCLLKADKVARAAAILNANLETSDEKANLEASDEKESESRLEKGDA
jgi:hypothetical protein